MARARSADWKAKFAAEAWKLSPAPHSDPVDNDLTYEMAGQLCEAEEKSSAEQLDTLAVADAIASRLMLFEEPKATAWGRSPSAPR